MQKTQQVNVEARAEDISAEGDIEGTWDIAGYGYTYGKKDTVQTLTLKRVVDWEEPKPSDPELDALLAEETAIQDSFAAVSVL